MKHIWNNSFLNCGCRWRLLRWSFFTFRLGIITLFCTFLCRRCRTTTTWKRLRACLHVGRGPQVGEVTCGGQPHLTCKRDQIKMRDYMDRRVTPPTRVPPRPHLIYQGREHKTTTFFFVSWTLIESFGIQLQNNLPRFDELNEMEKAR